MRVLTCIVAAIMLTGCAATGANYTPLVDHGRSSGSYEVDLSECQAYAAQRAGAAEGAVAGAVFGALVGVALAAAVGGGIRNEMAGLGAISGGLQGAAAGEGSQRDIIRRCLAGRGHNVLD